MQCSSTDTTHDIEQDVFLIETHNNFDIDGHIISNGKKQERIYFSKDFWDFFIKKFPKSSGMIFISPLYQEHQNYFKLGDTSLAFFDVDIMAPMFFKRLLPHDPNSKETDSHGGFYVIPKDTAGQTERQKRVDKKLSTFNLSNDVRTEYSKLFKILTNDKSEDHYIIVYKKSFRDKIYRLYE